MVMRTRWRYAGAAAAALSMGLGLATIAEAQTTPRAAASRAAAACSAFQPSPSFSPMAQRLAGITDAPTNIITAKMVPADRDQPALCEVEGQIAPTIGFLMRMPAEGWNGKLLMIGCGGPCGVFFINGIEPPLVRGYAVVATDMGHRGAGWVFGYNNLQGLIDFGSRATHLTAVVAKEMIDAYYGVRPKQAYFTGCSTGGRQAMIEAQRFPEDFTGLVAGAPPYEEIGDTPYFLSWNARVNIDAAGRPILDAAKLPMVHKAVMDSCATKSDAAIGVLQNPAACNWDPTSILCKPGGAANSCLTGAEADVVRKIYEGASNSKGRKLYFGMARGSETNWSPHFINTGGKPGDYLSGFGGAGNSLMNYGAFFYAAGPNYQQKDFDYDRDPPRLGVLAALYDPRNPDLRDFKAAGGKLILYHGWNDHQIPPGASIDYYEGATRMMGGAENTRDFFRLFMLPGVQHCLFGPGGADVDWLTALENWVEKGQAPDQVIAYKLKAPYPTVTTAAGAAVTVTPRYPLPPDSYERARPVFPYPAIAQWDGQGDPAKPSSWVKTDR